MITAGLQGTPLPEPTDPDNVPYHLGLAVGHLEPRVVMRFSSEADRDSKITEPVQGMLADCGALIGYTTYQAGAWRRLRWLDPVVDLYATAPQTIPTEEWTALGLTGETLDDENLHAPGAPGIRIGAHLGWWEVQGVAAWATSTDGTVRRSALALNGARLAGTMGSANPSTSYPTAATPLRLIRASDSADTVALYGWHDRGTNLATIAVNEVASTLHARWVRPL